MHSPIIIGDIHGNVTLLRALIEELGPCTRPFIFLGDYVNRGQDSKAVIELLLQFKSEGNDVRFLCGNHDWAFLQYIQFGKFDRFALLGGLQTIASYLSESPSGDVRSMLLKNLPNE